MHVVETKSTRLVAEKGLLPKWNVAKKVGTPEMPDSVLLPSTRYAITSTARIFGMLVALLLMAPWSVHVGSPLTLMLLAPLVGAYINKLTFIMHDCAHNTLFASPKANQVVGMICGALLLVEFRVFRDNHWAHHQNYGYQGDDPQGSDYLGFEAASRMRIVLHLLRPLFGYNAFKVFQLNSVPGAPGRKDREHGGKKQRSALRYDGATHCSLMAVVHSVVACMVTGGGRIWWLVFLYPVAAGTFGLFFSQVRGFCEHVAPAGAETARHVRTHRPNWIDGVVFYDLNFNFHVEHHLYPQMPSCNLQMVYRQRLRDGSYTEEELSPRILTTIWRRVVRQGR